MGHFYPRQAVLAPAGLITEPNEYGQYPPGALKIARNVTMREPGKLVQAPGAFPVAFPGPVGGVIHKLMPADSGAVYALVRGTDVPFPPSDDIWSIYRDGSPQTFVRADGSVFTEDEGTFSATGRISWAQCGDRIIVNGRHQNLVRDPVPLSADFRAAGLPQIHIVAAGVTIGTGWLEPQHSVQYRACVVRRYADDYTLRSAPSLAFRARNSIGVGGLSGNPYVTIGWPEDGGLEPGDIIELYRTDVLATTSDYADTGATYKLVREHILTAADLTAGFFSYTDTQPPLVDSLVTQGRELYTNPGVEGENYANLRPPIAQCIVSFKGFCFYANTTERAQLVFGIPGGWGGLSDLTAVGIPPETSLSKGIGTRHGAGTFTSGSPIITAVPDTTGVVVGQRWIGSSTFPTGTTVIAVSANTITMSQPVDPVIQDSEWSVEDVIEINGVLHSMARPDTLLADLDGLMEAQFDQTLGVGAYAAFTFRLMWNNRSLARPISVRATHGQNYSPPLPELAATPAQDPKTIDTIIKKNRLCWSKEQQPEHAPSVSETFVGFAEIYACNATRDAIWIWCSDGLYRLSGNGGSLGLGAWEVNYTNATLLLCGPQASTVLDDRVYGYTNDGIVQVDSAGNVKNLTVGVIGNLVPGQRYIEAMAPLLERNEVDGEVLLALGELEVESGPAPLTGVRVSNRIYVYHVREDAWTYLEDAGDRLSNVSAIAMFRLPPDSAEPHVLFAVIISEDFAAMYSRWTGGDADSGVYLSTTTQYQPLYGEDPLELKRWMWADFLFGLGSASEITVLWNDLSFSSVPTEGFDVGLYARAGCPREGGLSHSICPGFEWDSASFQSRFEGISLAIKQRTNQSKQR